MKSINKIKDKQLSGREYAPQFFRLLLLKNLNWMHVKELSGILDSPTTNLLILYGKKRNKTERMQSIEREFQMIARMFIKDFYTFSRDEIDIYDHSKKDMLEPKTSIVYFLTMNGFCISEISLLLKSNYQKTRGYYLRAMERKEKEYLQSQALYLESLFFKSHKSKLNELKRII